MQTSLNRELAQLTRRAVTELHFAARLHPSFLQLCNLEALWLGRNELDQ
eukprot:gene20574-25546_t